MARPTDKPTDPFTAFIESAKHLGLSEDALVSLVQNARHLHEQDRAASAMARVTTIMAEAAPYGRYAIVVAPPANEGDRATVSWTYANTLPMSHKGAGGKKLLAIKIVKALRDDYSPLVGKTFDRDGDNHPALAALRQVEPDLATDIAADASKLHNLVNYVKSRFTYESA